MKWMCKGLLQLAFSYVPFGAQLNYFGQRYVTRNLPASEAEFAIRMSIAKEHIDVAREYLRRPLEESVFYEFGTGWDLMIPMTLYALGVERQILVDIRNLLRLELVNDTIKKLQRISADSGLLRKPGRVLGRKEGFLPSLKEHYGIEYRAPCDARHTGLEAGSIDFITSTHTLEHIPPHDIQAILQECHRLLRHIGLMSVRIDYQDHYAHFDSGISAYNFLRYSDKVWALFSLPLNCQNRLRHRDYLDLFQAGGFEVLEERRTDGTLADRETIKQLPLDKKFRAYSPEELAVRGAHIVLHKR